MIEYVGGLGWVDWNWAGCGDDWVVFGVMLMLGCRTLNPGEKGELRRRGLRWLASSSAGNEKDGSGKE